MEENKNKRGRRKTKDRVSTSIFLDRDLHEWTVGKNRSDLINSALRFAYNNRPPGEIINAWVDQVIKTEDEIILKGLG